MPSGLFRASHFRNPGIIIWNCSEKTSVRCPPYFRPQKKSSASYRQTARDEGHFSPARYHSCSWMKFMRSKDTELPGKFLYPLHITVDTVCVYSLNPVKRFPSYHLYSLQVPHENALAVCPSDFGQPLRGEFHGFLPLLPTSQQFSVLRSSCTIPLQRFLFIETVYKLSCYHRVVKKNFCSRHYV